MSLSEINIGGKIKKIRKERRLNQADLAVKSKMSCNFIGLIERNKQSPSVDSLYKLAEGLDMSISELIFELFCDKDSNKTAVNGDRGYFITDDGKKDIYLKEISACLPEMNIEELYSLTVLIKAIANR